MKDKDKLFLLFNLYVGHIAEKDIDNYAANIANSFTNYFDDSVKCIFRVTKNENLPAVQCITDFPWSGEEIVLQLENAIKKNDDFEIKERAKALCEIAKAFQDGIIKTDE